ncbi:MAG: DUF362 domain-containing protein [Caldilineaceae bacterium]|nr:DUF362 domain-containing protein [Caldilineaceae bacterium]
MTRSSHRPTSAAERVISRRAFVHAAAATGAALALSACAPVTANLPLPTITPAPSAADTATRAKVALVRTGDRTEGLRRLLTLTGLPDVAGKQVVIKPNFNSADPAPGSTHPDILRGMVQALQAAGAQRITVADRSGMGNTRQVMAQLGIDALAEELGFDLVVLDELGADDWEIVDVPGSHWSRGFPFPRLVSEADTVVQLCCLKTHRFGGHFTLSLKNTIGLVGKYLPGESYNYMNELHGSEHQRTMIAEANAPYTPALVVMDGVAAFVSGGPDRGELVDAQVMLAGSDRVALDAVGVALLRHFGTTPQVATGPVRAQEQIARAVELGLGLAAAEQIDLVSDDADADELIAAVHEILATE